MAFPLSAATLAQSLCLLSPSQPPVITATPGPRESFENANLLNTGFLLKMAHHFQALPEQAPAYLSSFILSSTGPHTLARCLCPGTPQLSTLL